MKKQTKTEADSLLRIPKSKPKFGLKIKPIAMPHADLIKPESPPALELVEKKSHTSQSSLPSHTRQTQEIAPTKDFSKVANSIAKLAVPDGWFKGKSKQLYDALYLLTRGAISPARVIRIQKTKLMKLSCIGARNTFDRNIEHLTAVGLLKETVFAGEHEGNEFEVFLPEEITLTRQSSQTSSSPKLDRLVTLETSQTRQAQTIENIDDSETLRLSLKTIINDDETTRAFAAFHEEINRTLVDLTGREARAKDSEKWKMIAKLLVMELKIAAARTEAISNAPAFLYEHLRRRLLRNDSKATNPQTSKLSKNLTNKTAAIEEIEYFAEPLGDQGRKTVLKTMNEFVEEGKLDFVRSLEKTYTPEDWSWLMDNLK
ncbi:MAG: hypothetical protein ACR2L1_03870 [Pyrinomonadaceae bacterium]